MKPQKSLTSLQRGWISRTQHPSHFESKNDNQVYCKPCEKFFAFKKVSQLLQHEETNMHTLRVTRYVIKPETQLTIDDTVATATTDRKGNQFFIDLTEAMVSANIPWFKIQNAKLREFLEYYTGKHIPNDSTLRKLYLPKIYSKSLDAIRKDVGEQFAWLSVDETTDASGRYIANVIVGALNKKKASKSHLLMSRQLEFTNNSTITQLVLSALNLLWPSFTQAQINERFLLLLTDSVPYMKKAGKNLKATYNNLLHVTCAAHALNLVAEAVRKIFRDVDQLIASVKATFRKCPSRVLKYKAKCPLLELPPQPVITRWGTWLEAVEFYAINFNSVKAVVDSFDSEDASCVATAQQMFAKKNIAMNLAYISSNFTFLCSKIQKLQEKDLSLSEGLKILTGTENKLKEGKGKVCEKILLKWNAIQNKNKDLQVLYNVQKVLDGNEEVELDLSPAQVSALKYAPITSVDVERSFSVEKLIFSDARRSMTAENLEMTVVSQLAVTNLENV